VRKTPTPNQNAHESEIDTVLACAANKNKKLGYLNPTGGGDPIPLLRPVLRIGRHDRCDIVLKFGNVSAKHCELTLDSGYWFVTDTGSTNGVKVDGARIDPNSRKRLDPGCEIRVAKHTYRVEYSPNDLGAVGPPPEDGVTEIPKRSLLDIITFRR